MEESKPWILRFVDMPQSLIEDDSENSLEILCHHLFGVPETAAIVFDVIDSLIPATYETLYMVFWSSFFAMLIGLPLGVFLTITKKDSLLPMPMLNKVIGMIVNMLRSFPFIILIIVIWPLSKLLIGVSIGPKAAAFSLSIAAIPFVARLFENALEEVHKGIIEATLSMGASKIEVVYMMIAESLPSLINAATIMIISIIGFSAMAGTVGGGGLGDLAIKLGFYDSRMDILYACVIVLMIMVQVAQSIGDYLSRILRTHEYGILQKPIYFCYRIFGRIQK